LPRVGIPGAPGASRHHLVEWLATFGAIWAALTWLVPAIAAQLWPGVSWPEPTQAFVALSGFVRSWPGLGCGLFVVIASIVVYVRHRRSPGVRWLFTGLTLFGWLAVVPAGFVSLGLPLIQIGGGRL
jgi:sterol desaturase/sphingolipid hydroxylase (fatty acid hydroxylase superfamily)